MDSRLLEANETKTKCPLYCFNIKEHSWKVMRDSCLLMCAHAQTNIYDENISANADKLSN